MKHIVKSVIILTIFSLIDRLLGFGFKIYLSYELGAVNLGIYQVALSVFFVLLTFTTSGTPLIVSKMTAVFKSKNDKKGEYATVSAALIVGLCLSALICIIVYFGSPVLENVFTSKESMNLLILLLPAVVLSGIYSAFRGNLWGHQRHFTIAIIELIEQVSRIGVCVLLFLLGFNKLEVTALSMSVACGVTAICCICCYFSHKGRLLSAKGYIKPLIKEAMPITMIRASNTFVMSLVSLAVPFLLLSSNYTVTESLSIFATSVGMAMPLLYLPITVVGSLSYVMIPTLSQAYASNNKESVNRQISNALTFSLLISAVFVPFYFALGDVIGVFVYDNLDAGKFLSFSAFLLVPVSAESIVSSMMNSLDLQKASFINYLVGSIIMFAILFAFYGNFTINILAIALGSSLVVSLVLDIIAIKRKTDFKLDFISPLIKCVLLIFPTTIFISSLYNLMPNTIEFFRIAISGTAGFVFFAILALLFGAVDKSLVLVKLHKNKQKKSKIERKRVAN